MNLFIAVSSDVHGFIMPTDYLTADSYAPLGLAKMAAVLEAIRQEKKHVIYIDNGDLIQGSALSQYLALKEPERGPAPIIEVLNDMGCDAAVLGNHEFNYGRDYLQKGIDVAHFPVLSANILDVTNKEPVFKPYTVVERSGVKIAILGLITRHVPYWEKPQHIQGLIFEDPVAAAALWVPRLKRLADVVIVAYHGGFEYDPFSGQKTFLQQGENEALRILKAAPQMDCLITGHQHREIAGIFRGIPVVMPSWGGRAFGLVQLVLKRQGEKWRVRPKEALLLRNARVVPDPAIVERVMPLHERVEAWLDSAIGHVEGDMTISDPIQARRYLHPYVAFVNELQMKVADVDIACTSIFHGKAKGLPKDITVRDIVSNYIYSNTLAVLEVSGADLRAALEQCARFFDLDKEGNLIISEEFSEPFIQYYNYDIYSGIDYTFDIRQAPGQRVVELLYHGQDIQDHDRLKIVMNNYRANGSGHFPMYSQEKVIKDIQIDMTDLLVNHILEHPVIEATPGSGFTVLP